MTDKVFELIDTHAHLDLDDFDADRTETIERNRKGIFPLVHGREIGKDGSRFRVVAIISPGISVESSRAALALAAEDSLFHPAIGIHPNYTANLDENAWPAIEEMAAIPGVVAIGETGLDRYWDHSPIETQIEYLKRHFELARRLALPILIHCRDAHADLMPLLREEAAKNRPGSILQGVIHSFSGDLATARECIELGFHLGFGGSVTFTGRKFADVWEAARLAPADRILLETDSPFLTPHPFRGKLERNEPIMTAFVARRLAELRNTSMEEITRICYDNATRLFRLNLSERHNRGERDRENDKTCIKK